MVAPGGQGLLNGVIQSHTVNGRRLATASLQRDEAPVTMFLERGFIKGRETQTHPAPAQRRVIHPSISSGAKNTHGLQDAAFPTAIGADEDVDLPQAE